jgi:hypothetical protein
MAATTPAMRSQMVRSLGAPVKSSDKREPNEAEACMPKMISTTPTTSNAIPTRTHKRERAIGPHLLYLTE